MLVKPLSLRQTLKMVNDFSFFIDEYYGVSHDFNIATICMLVIINVVAILLLLFIPDVPLFTY